MAKPDSDQSHPPAREIDRISYMLGMITAFGECVAAEAKPCAFSPPFYPDDYDDLKEPAEQIMREMGLHFQLEENREIDAQNRVLWWVMCKCPKILEKYLAIRGCGYNPAYEFDRFEVLLGYGYTFAEGIKQIEPKIQRPVDTMATVKRLLFSERNWPLEPDTRRSGE